MLGACQRDCLRVRGSVKRGGGRWGRGWRETVEREREREMAVRREREGRMSRERETERDGVEREREGEKVRE